jgi:hypothetical protein
MLENLETDVRVSLLIALVVLWSYWALKLEAKAKAAQGIVSL